MRTGPARQPLGGVTGASAPAPGQAEGHPRLPITPAFPNHAPTRAAPGARATRSPNRMSSLFRVKPLDRLLGEAGRPDQQLRRTLGPIQLTLLGIGAIVGAGIFSTVGTAAAGGPKPLRAGPPQGH